MGFQSTRPRGARPTELGGSPDNMGFNPRAHAGRDAVDYRFGGVDKLFQSTRPRGARLAELK